MIIYPLCLTRCIQMYRLSGRESRSQAYRCTTDTSPYDTGDHLFGMSRHYKQLSAALGDAFFHAPRRYLAQGYHKLGHKQQWAYHFEIGPPHKLLPFLGVFHAFEIFHVFGSLHTVDSFFQKVTLGLSKVVPGWFEGLLPQAQDLAASDMIMDYWCVFDLCLGTLHTADLRLNFINNLDPNGGNQAFWPAYGQEGNMLRLLKSGVEVATDDYRKEQIGYMIDHADVFHF